MRNGQGLHGSPHLIGQMTGAVAIGSRQQGDEFLAPIEAELNAA